MDPNIMCGLTIRSRALQYGINGKPNNKTLWKHLLAGLVDTALFWSTHTWLWELLGISLLLPHKGDILSKKSVRKNHCLIQSVEQTAGEDDCNRNLCLSNEYMEYFFRICIIPARHIV